MDTVRHKGKSDKSYRHILFGSPFVSPNTDCLMLKYAWPFQQPRKAYFGDFQI